MQNNLPEGIIFLDIVAYLLVSKGFLFFIEEALLDAVNNDTEKNVIRPC